METQEIEKEISFDLFTVEVLSRYSAGELIPHNYLKDLFKIEMPSSMDGFEDVSELIKAAEEQNFQYMGMVEKLRSHLLREENYYLQSIWGQGYKILLPKEQQVFAFEQAMKDVKKALAGAKEIMCHVRLNEVDPETRAKGADMAVKLSTFRQFVESARKY